MKFDYVYDLGSGWTITYVIEPAGAGQVVISSETKHDTLSRSTAQAMEIYPLELLRKIVEEAP